MKSRSEIKTEATSKLTGNIGKLVLEAIIVSVVMMLINYIPKIFGIPVSETVTREIFGFTYKVTSTTKVGYCWDIVSNVLSLTLNFGVCLYLLNLIRGKEAKYSDIFNAFTGGKLVTVLLVSLVTTLCIYIGTLLLIVPGIIAAMGLSFCNYVMIDNPDLKFMDVIKTTWNMMNGHKMDFFVFILSFIGWILLCVLIIPLVYVVPYIMVAETIFYENLKGLNK